MFTLLIHFTRPVMAKLSLSSLITLFIGNELTHMISKFTNNTTIIICRFSYLTYLLSKLSLRFE